MPIATQAPLQNQEKAKHRGAIVSPIVDFLLFGGLSFIVLFIHFYSGWDQAWADYQFGWGAFYLAFLINHPHFMHSYQLFYAGFLDKIAEGSAVKKFRFILSGFVVPIVLLLWLFWGMQNASVHTLGLMVNMMFFLVGWHYFKQGYGIMIVLAGRQKQFLSEMTKKIALINGYAVWLMTWVHINLTEYTNQYYGIPYSTFGLPDALGYGTKALAVVTTLLFVAMVVRHYHKYKDVPVNALVAYVSALYLWLGFWRLDTAAFVLIPALHSLQYIPFCWKITSEKEKLEKPQAPKSKNIVIRHPRVMQFAAVGVVTGALFFYGLPYLTDKWGVYDQSVLGSQFGFFAFLIFINLHHYFLDYALWRKDNKDMGLLFR